MGGDRQTNIPTDRETERKTESDRQTERDIHIHGNILCFYYINFHFWPTQSPAVRVAHATRGQP